MTLRFLGTPCHKQKLEIYRRLLSLYWEEECPVMWNKHLQFWAQICSTLSLIPITESNSILLGKVITSGLESVPMSGTPTKNNGPTSALRPHERFSLHSGTSATHCAESCNTPPSTLIYLRLDLHVAGFVAIQSKLSSHTNTFYMYKDPLDVINIWPACKCLWSSYHYH